MRTIITIILALVAMTGLAQEIKMNETAISDYIPLLNAKGYQAYSFDVSAIKGRNVEIYCREFVNRKEVEDSPRLLFPYYFEARGDRNSNKSTGRVKTNTFTHIGRILSNPHRH